MLKLTGQELVYSDKDLALKALKKFSGARFKVFKTKTEAERFSLQPAEEICPSPWKATNGTGKVLGTPHLQCICTVKLTYNEHRYCELTFITKFV